MPPSPLLVHTRSWHSIARLCILHPLSVPLFLTRFPLFTYGLFNLSTTTDFLTATSTTDTLGAGVTAAAGTSLALQSFLTFYLILVSSLPPLWSGQFSRLLPSMDVVAISQAPSPVSDIRPPSPVIAFVVHYTTY